MTDNTMAHQNVISDSALEKFKADYYRCKGGKNNLVAQVPYLTQIAQGYEEAFGRTRHWRYALQAHGLFLALHTREPENEEWKLASFRIQQCYWSGNVTTTLAHQEEVTGELKQLLSSIRASMADGLKTLGPVISNLVGAPSSDNDEPLDDFYEAVTTLSTSCTEQMIDLVKRIIHESVIMLSEPPPCSFSSVVIGSLARGEATPYSDVEYLFLIEDNKPSTIEYFERLAMTTYFLFNNLGETPLKYFAIDELQGWFDDEGTSGLKIDGLSKGAGNIPTGNGSSNKKNKFILTVDELFEDYKTVLDNPTEESLRGDLTAMLLYTREVYSSGQPGLLEKFLAKMASCEKNETRRKADRAMLIADVKKFNYMPNAEWRNGYVLNAKQDLFRFPSILLYDLSIIFNVKGETNWETLDKLIAGGKFSHSVHSALRMLSATASYIRLNTYSHFQQHNDTVSILKPLSDKHSVIDNDETAAHLQPTLFFKLCACLIPLKVHLKLHLEDLDVSLTSELNQPVDLLMAIVYYNCSQFQEAHETFVEIFQVDIGIEHNVVHVYEQLRRKTVENDELTYESLYIMGWTLFRCHKFKAALKYFQLLRDELDEHAALYPKALNGMGVCLSRLGKSKEAADLYEQTLKSMENPTTDAEYIGVLKANYGLMIALSTRNYQQAMEKCMEALQIFYSSTVQPPMFDYYGNQIYSNAYLDLSALSENELIEHLRTPSFRQAWCLRYISVILKEQRQFHKAIKYLEVSLKMYHSIHKQYAYDYYLRNTASELAEDYLNLHDFDKALKSLIIQLDATYSLYGRETDKRVIAYLLCSIGSTLTKLLRVEEAEDYLVKSIHMYNRLLGENTSDILVARVLRCIGNNYHASGSYDKALEYYQRSLQMYEKALSSSKDKRDIAFVLNDIGDTYNLLKMFKEAHDQLKSAQELLEDFHGIKASRPSIGKVYCSIGKNYLMQGEIEEAKTCFNVALSAYECMYRHVEPKHPTITELEQLILDCS